jgi:hypothetical protein
MILAGRRHPKWSVPDKRSRRRGEEGQTSKDMAANGRI